MLRIIATGLIGLALGGCSTECENPGRMDGTYAALSTIANSEPSGQNLENYPTSDGWAPDSFFNGWSTWTLKYVPGEKSFEMTIDDQPFTAVYAQDADNCSAFKLTIDRGLWEGSSGAAHVVDWSADLLFSGEKIAGTYAYSDAWSVEGGASSGTIEIAEGEVVATAAGAGDTGF